VKARLDLAVSDLGATQLKNIAEPVRVYSLQVGVPAQAKPAAPLPQTSAPSSAPRLSIVVLPFANIGGDPEQEYFVDGVTESLTTDLSRISGSFVIGRNTAFTYKGKHVDLKQIVQFGNVLLKVGAQDLQSERCAARRCGGAFEANPGQHLSLLITARVVVCDRTRLWAAASVIAQKAGASSPNSACLRT
jgi:hypothetical protein